MPKFYFPKCCFQFSDLTRFYIACDNELMIDMLKWEINFLKSAWQNLLGRPLVTLALRRTYLGPLRRFSVVVVVQMKITIMFLGL